MKRSMYWVLLACLTGTAVSPAQAATWDCCGITAEAVEGKVIYEAVLPTVLGGDVTPRQVLLDLWLEQTGNAGLLAATVAVAGVPEELDGEGPFCFRETFLLQEGGSGVRATIDVTGLVQSLGPGSVSRLYFRLESEAGGASVALKENEEWGCAVRSLWRAER